MRSVCGSKTHIRNFYVVRHTFFNELVYAFVDVGGIAAAVVLEYLNPGVACPRVGASKGGPW